MLKLNYKAVLFFLITFRLALETCAAAPKEIEIVNFSNSWLLFDNHYEAYIPIPKNKIRNNTCIHQALSVEKIKPYLLRFTAAKGLSVFVNNKLIYKKVTDKSEVVVIPLQSVLTENGGEAILTFYHPEGKLPFNNSSIINQVLLSEEESKEANNQLLMVRDTNSMPDGLVILFISILVLVVLFKQFYPKEFQRYFSLQIHEHNEFIQQSSFSVPVLWMTVMVGLAFALLAYILNVDEVLLNSNKDSSIFFGAITIAFFYIAFTLSKFLYTSIIAWLFSYSKIVSAQHSEYSRLMEKIFFFTAILAYAVFVSGFIKIDISIEILYFSFILVLIICLIKVIFLFFRLISHRNLYLFSYICAAEILPLIIAVKIILF